MDWICIGILFLCLIVSTIRANHALGQNDALLDLFKRR